MVDNRNPRDHASEALSLCRSGYRIIHMAEARVRELLSGEEVLGTPREQPDNPLADAEVELRRALTNIESAAESIKKYGRRLTEEMKQNSRVNKET